MRDAARALREEYGVDHIDLNFGCPVRKVTARGGGAAIPLKLGLFRDLVAAAVAGAGDVPVTVKMRIGVTPTLVCVCVCVCVRNLSASVHGNAANKSPQLLVQHTKA